MKHRITIAALLLLLTVTAHSQDAIERLLPQLLACDNIDIRETISNDIFNDGKNRYSFLINTTPVGNLPEGLLDSLVAAFEYEHRFATANTRVTATAYSTPWLTMALTIPSPTHQS